MKFAGVEITPASFEWWCPKCGTVRSRFRARSEAEVYAKAVKHWQDKHGAPVTQSSIFDYPDV